MFQLAVRVNDDEEMKINYDDKRRYREAKEIWERGDEKVESTTDHDSETKAIITTTTTTKKTKAKATTTATTTTKTTRSSKRRKK